MVVWRKVSSRLALVCVCGAALHEMRDPAAVIAPSVRHQEPQWRRDTWLEGWTSTLLCLAEATTQAHSEGTVAEAPRATNTTGEPPGGVRA